MPFSLIKFPSNLRATNRAHRCGSVRIEWRLGGKKVAKIGKPFLAPCAPPGTYPPAPSSPGDDMMWRCHGATNAELVSNLQSMRTIVPCTSWLEVPSSFTAIHHGIHSAVQTYPKKESVISLLISLIVRICRAKDPHLARGGSCHVKSGPEALRAGFQARLQ